MKENKPTLLSHYINDLEDSGLYQFQEVRVLIDNIRAIQHSAKVYGGWGTDKELLVEVLRNITEWEVE